MREEAFRGYVMSQRINSRYCWRARCRSGTAADGEESDYAMLLAPTRVHGGGTGHWQRVMARMMVTGIATEAPVRRSWARYQCDDFSGAVSACCSRSCCPPTPRGIGYARATGDWPRQDGLRRVKGQRCHTALVGWAMLYVRGPAPMDPEPAARHQASSIRGSWIERAASHIDRLTSRHQIMGVAGGVLPTAIVFAASRHHPLGNRLSFVGVPRAVQRRCRAVRHPSTLCTGPIFLGGFSRGCRRQLRCRMTHRRAMVIIRVYESIRTAPFAILLINLAPLPDSIHPKPFRAR